MNTFLKKVSNFLVYVTTLLAIIAFIEKKIDPAIILLLTAAFLFAGFLFLIITHFSQIEKKIVEIEINFKREVRLINIEKDVEALKLNITKNK